MINEFKRHFLSIIIDQKNVYNFNLKGKKTALIYLINRRHILIDFILNVRN